MVLDIRPGLHACISNNRVALLDLEADRYLCLPPALDRIFQNYLASRPSAERSTIEPLMNAGLLTEQPSPRGTPALSIHTEPESSLLEDNRRTANGRLLALALFSQLRTRTWLRSATLNEIVTHLGRRRARMEIRSKRLVDNETLFDLATAYFETRKLVSTQNKCLQRSVGMLEFLLSYSGTARLIIGVRMQPFRAHAWCQHEGVILNDTVDEARLYTPILVL